MTSLVKFSAENRALLFSALEDLFKEATFQENDCGYSNYFYYKHVVVDLINLMLILISQLLGLYIRSKCRHMQSRSRVILKSKSIRKY